MAPLPENIGATRNGSCRARSNAMRGCMLWKSPGAAETSRAGCAAPPLMKDHPLIGPRMLYTPPNRGLWEELSLRMNMCESIDE